MHDPLPGLHQLASTVDSLQQILSELEVVQCQVGFNTVKIANSSTYRGKVLIILPELQRSRCYLP